MINFKTYSQIIDFLDKDETEKLREYLYKERQRYYLESARRALVKYLKEIDTRMLAVRHEFEDGKLLASNSSSMFLFNTNELLTNNSRESLKGIDDEKNVKILMDCYNQFEDEKYYPVDRIERSLVFPDNDVLINYNNDTELFFNKSNLNYAKKFLGDEVELSINNDIFLPTCKAESEKGKGIILGYRYNLQHYNNSENNR